MPELPDVEGWKRYVSRFAEGRRVRGVRVIDAQVVRNTSSGGLSRALRGRRLGRPRRLGKWLIVPVGDAHLVLHFGMTGALSWTSKPDGPAAHDRLILKLEGGDLSYRTQRKLGGVWWVSGDREVTDVTGPLGPDAAGVSDADLRERLGGRRGAIKAALMNQKTVAGIGNELSDEILWRARLRPDRPVAEIDERGLKDIHRAMQDVLKRSMKRGHIPVERGWLETERGADEPRCPRCRASLETSKVAGRTAYWCPRCQR